MTEIHSSLSEKGSAGIELSASEIMSGHRSEKASESHWKSAVPTHLYKDPVPSPTSQIELLHLTGGTCLTQTEHKTLVRREEADAECQASIM